jgi:hypothetical protein
MKKEIIATLVDETGAGYKEKDIEVQFEGAKLVRRRSVSIGRALINNRQQAMGIGNVQRN